MTIPALKPASSDPAPYISANSNAPLSLTQSIALEEAAIPGVLHTASMLIGGLMTLFLVWASFTHIEEISSSTGQVIPNGYVQNIQHPDGGIITEILVEEGELVEKGQILVKLDDTNAQADLGQMQARQQALELQISRLRSYTGTAGEDHKVPLSKSETAILNSMEDARSQQMNILQDQVAQKEKELAALSAMRAAL